ncbi:dynactin subunit 6-like [Oppia nitens]|uniref:dynactin subunit 6-like n=1 Tax=Oppia nitens TaxID=1686743 RepID=UPI0023DA88EE|nr:dynactin subunit 6-like [Oppia nitens]
MSNMSTNKQNVKISIGSIVCCEETTLLGDITIGAKTVIHPTAVIDATKGPVVIGESNLIEERVHIINTCTQPLIIGSHNVFEVGSHCQSQHVGDHNVLESKCRVGSKTLLSNGCVIGAMCCVDCDQLLPENTVIFGTDCRRRTQNEKPTQQTYQLDFLSKILPNYQRIEKPNFKSNTQTNTAMTTSTSSTASLSPH